MVAPPTINATVLAECPDLRRKRTRRSAKKPKINTIITSAEHRKTASSAIRSNYNHLVTLQSPKPLVNKNKKQWQKPGICTLIVLYKLSVIEYS